MYVNINMKKRRPKVREVKAPKKNIYLKFLYSFASSYINRYTQKPRNIYGNCVTFRLFYETTVNFGS